MTATPTLAAFASRHGHLVTNVLGITAREQTEAADRVADLLAAAQSDPQHACNAPGAVMPTSGLPTVLAALRESAQAWQDADEAWSALLDSLE